MSKLTAEELKKEEKEKRQIEKVARHEAALAKRASWKEKSTKLGRRKIALSQLEAQLEEGTKPISRGHHPQLVDKDGNLRFETLKDGSKKPIRASRLDLNHWEKHLIQNQITSLKTKLKIA